MYSNIVKEKKKRTQKVRKIVPDSMISSILGERDQKKRRNSQDYRSEFPRAREKLTCDISFGSVCVCACA